MDDEQVRRELGYAQQPPREASAPPPAQPQPQPQPEPVAAPVPAERPSRLRVPLLEERTPNAELASVVGGPLALGIVAGLLLGASEIAYLVVSVLAVLGGYLAGFEHRGAREGFYRGLLGGLLFGTTVLLTHAIVGAEAKAELPEPEVYLVAITAILGLLLGTLGGRAREKRERARDR